MRIYLEILFFNFQQFIHYPLEILAALLSNIITVFFTYIFWTLVLKATGQESDIYMLVGYFLIAEGMGNLTMIFRQKFGSLLRKSIKDGSITNFIIKPIGVLPSMYATVWGRRSVPNISSLVMMILGIVLIHPTSVVALVLFVYFLIVAFLLAYSMNLFEGILTFHVTEPGGIMNAIAHTTRLLSGAFIPLYFFPDTIRNVADYLPFTMMIFTPINMLSQNSINHDVVRDLLLGTFWSGFALIITYILWKKGLRKYEAVGL